MGYPIKVSQPAVTEYAAAYLTVMLNLVTNMNSYPKTKKGNLS
jgi:hypothetical protein